MSQISLNPTSVSKVQSSAHLKKQTLGVQIKIRIVFLSMVHCFVLLYILYTFMEFISPSFTSPPHQPTRQSPGWMPSEL